MSTRPTRRGAATAPAEEATAAATKAKRAPATATKAGSARTRKAVAANGTTAGQAAAPPAPAMTAAEAELAPAVTGSRSRWAVITDPASLVPTYFGIAVVLLGFVLVFIGWADVAGQADVFLQMPYLLSAGIPGLGLIMVGLVIVNVSARRQDGARRARQMAALGEVLADLRRTLEGR